MLWVLVISVGWFGVKGGVFTILTGGVHRVYGPPGGSFISDNNAICHRARHGDSADVLPELDGRAQDRSSWGLGVAALLSLVAVLGSQSRGALLAVAAMSVFLWLKSRKKIVFGVDPVRLARGRGHVHAGRLGRPG